MRFVDLHCDTIMHFYGGKSFSNMEDAHISLRKLQQGGCLAQCFAIFIPTHEQAVLDGIKDTPSEYMEKAYRAFLSEMEANATEIRQALTVEDILENEKHKVMSALLTIEDSVCLDGRLEKLDHFYEMGVRMATITWNYENSLGYPQNMDEELNAKGLKPFGIEAVRRMNELGIAVDVSHLSEGGFWDVVKYTKRPIIASHSCARHYCPIARNLSDEQIKAIGESGGVIGVNFAHDFLENLPWGDKSQHFTTLREVVRNARYMADLAGVETIALGSDYDGIDSSLEWKDYSGMPLVEEALSLEFTGREVDLICRENALRALRDNIGR